MEFQNKELGVKFAVPDRPTVLQQMEYSAAAITFRRDVIFYINWRAALTLISDWECEAIPDPGQVFISRLAGDNGDGAIFLDEETNPNITDIVMWTGNQVATHMYNLENIPKN